MPSIEVNEVVIKELAKAILDEMTRGGFCLIPKKEWREVRRSVVALAKEMAHNSVRIDNIHDSIVSKERRAK